MLRLGEKQILYCISREEFGVYLAEEGWAPEKEKVLLPIKQVPEDLKIGDALEVFVYKDSKDRIISTVNEPFITTARPEILKIADTGKFGAFVDCGLERDILLPFKEQTHRVKKGDEVLVALYVDKSSRLCTTMKVYDHLIKTSPYKRDDVVTGFVYDISERFGVYVAVDGIYQGRIPPREYDDSLEYGQRVTARVSNVLKDGKMDLSLKKKAYKQMDDDAEALLSLLKSNGGRLELNDSSSPEDIRKITRMSKNAFKRAVGHLLKEEKIRFDRQGIIVKEDYR
ncbi:MAG: RNA-binding protein [Lachnospiraceae bacterium]|nr:RNA-binding protein [Lachnospiraceae bacterium]